jgi:3',5'-cyclic AMP phosphodiesterase CpdA
MNWSRRKALTLAIAILLVIEGAFTALWLYRQKTDLVPNDRSSDFTFFAVGDTQGREDIFTLMIEDANSQKPSFVLHLGDMTSLGTEEQYDKFLSTAEGLEVPLYTTPGNHDIKSIGIEAYQDHFGPGDYSFEYKNTLFVSVDSSQAGLSNVQYDWLEEELSGNQDHKIVFTHVPPIDPREGEDHAFLDEEEGQRFVSLMQQMGVDVVLNGHIHCFNQILRGNTLFVTSGGGGATLYETPENGGFYHYLKIDISMFGIDVIPVPLNWAELSTPPSIIIKRGDDVLNLTLEDLKGFDTVQGMSAFENQYGNWKGQGTYKGVSLRDLVELFGGMERESVIIVGAWDGYEQKYGYTNIYPNSTLLSIQGEMILAFAFDDEEVPDWEDGFRVVFLPQDGEYSNNDALITTDEDLLDGELVSAGSRWVRNVAEIEII